MKQNKAIQLAYLAGVIDSDGCISIHKTTYKSYKGGKAPSYRLQVLMNTPDGKIMDYLYGIFGGKIYACQNHGLGERTIYRWEVNGSKAGELCKKMIPFLRYKKKQAEVGYRFQTLFEKQNRGLTYRTTPLTEREIQEREKLYQLSRDLKRIFTPPAAVETKRSESSKDDKR